MRSGITAGQGLLAVTIAAALGSGCSPARTVQRADDGVEALRAHADTTITEVGREELLQRFSRLRARSGGLPGENAADPDRVDGGPRIEEFTLYSPTQRWGGLTDLGEPIKITWSLAMEDAVYYDSPLVTNELFSWMDGLWTSNGGTQQDWISRIEDCFLRWSELTGIEFERVTYDGNPWDDGAKYGEPGIPDVRGDIRIFLTMLDGSGGLLGVTEPPNGIGPDPSPGEITLDKEDWYLTPWYPPAMEGFGLYRTISHEIGHAVGLDHSCPSNDEKLMQPLASMGAPYYPQHDDIRGMHHLYGDRYEPNDLQELANPIQIYPVSPIAKTFGDIPSPEAGPYPGSLLSINGSDVDWFYFTVVAGMDLTLKLIPVGGPYLDGAEVGGGCSAGTTLDSGAVNNLKLELFRSIDANDFVHVATASNEPAGVTEELTEWLRFPGRYYVKVSGFGGSLAKPQLYKLTTQHDPHFVPVSMPGLCDDGNPGNGTETVDPVLESCRFEYLDDDCNYDSIPDSMQGLTDCNADGLPDECQVARYPARAANDCHAAQPILAGQPYEYTTAFADNDGGHLCTPLDHPDVWYRYTPRTNGLVTISTCGSEFYTGVAVFLSDPGSACDDLPLVTWCDFEECYSGVGQPPIGVELYAGYAVFEGVAGQEYLIQVTAGPSGQPVNRGLIRVLLEGPPDATNDCNGNGNLDDCEALADCNGNGVPDECELTGAMNFCWLNDNSATPGAVISAAGSLSVSANDLVLYATGLPPNKSGQFFFGPLKWQSAPEYSRCINGAIKRIPTIFQSNAEGDAWLSVDLTAYPQIEAGTTWSFQAWYRDPSGPANPNYTDAIELEFCP